MNTQQKIKQLEKTQSLLEDRIAVLESMVIKDDAKKEDCNDCDDESDTEA